MSEGCTHACIDRPAPLTPNLAHGDSQYAYTGCRVACMGMHEQYSARKCGHIKTPHGQLAQDTVLPLAKGESIAD